MSNISLHVFTLSEIRIKWKYVINIWKDKYVDGTNFMKLNNKFMNMIKRPYLILSYSKSHFPTAIPDSCSVKSEIKKQS